MFVPIFSSKGVTPKKLSKTELVINYILLCFFALLGMPSKAFVSEKFNELYPVLVSAIPVIIKLKQLK